MSDESFDGLSKALAIAVSRRRALKLFAATAGGAALSLAGARTAFGDDPGRCRKVGTICRRDSECCSGLCDPTTGRCACPGTSTLCPKSGQCITCPGQQVLNTTTCKCECASGTTTCGNEPLCCPTLTTCCIGTLNGVIHAAVCCPSGTTCCHTEGGDVDCCTTTQTCTSGGCM